jgi:hypothetical protein
MTHFRGSGFTCVMEIIISNTQIVVRMKDAGCPALCLTHEGKRLAASLCASKPVLLPSPSTTSLVTEPETNLRAHHSANLSSLCTGALERNKTLWMKCQLLFDKLLSPGHRGCSDFHTSCHSNNKERASEEEMDMLYWLG